MLEQIMNAVIHIAFGLQIYFNRNGKRYSFKCDETHVQNTAHSFCQTDVLQFIAICLLHEWRILFKWKLIKIAAVNCRFKSKVPVYANYMYLLYLMYHYISLFEVYSNCKAVTQQFFPYFFTIFYFLASLIRHSLRFYSYRRESINKS